MSTLPANIQLPPSSLLVTQAIMSMEVKTHIPADSAANVAVAADAFLLKQLRVSITDGRVFLGSLQCIDKEQNMVLKDAFEYVSLKDSLTRTGERTIGLVMVPGEHIVKVELQRVQ